MSRRLRGSAKEEWVRRMARFARSNQSVVRFCDDEGVSTPSFYQWRKRLDETRSRGTVSSGTACGDRRRRQRFMPVQVLMVDGAQHAAKTIVRLGHGIQIELGDDLTIVEAVIRQLTAAAQTQGNQGLPAADGGTSC